MNDETSITLVLTGGRAGQTVTLGNLPFVEGRYTLRGDLSTMGGLLRYMARIYAAFPEGSEELAKHQEPENGKAHADATAAGRQAEQVSGHVQPDGAPDETADDSGGAAGAGGAAAEHYTSGDRHEDARIREAILKLDPRNTEHWTSDGRPRMDAVEAKYGSAGITRKDVEAALPDFRRPQ